jgi:hypothetical protein
VWMRHKGAGAWLCSFVGMRAPRGLGRLDSLTVSGFTGLLKRHSLVTVVCGVLGVTAATCLAMFVVTPSYSATVKLYPSRKLYAAVGLLLGIAVGAGAAWLLELRRTRQLRESSDQSSSDPLQQRLETLVRHGVRVPVRMRPKVVNGRGSGEYNVRRVDGRGGDRNDLRREVVNGRGGAVVYSQCGVQK